MKSTLALLVLASAAAAAPRKCPNGAPPRLSGDLFAPVECSSAALPVAALPVPAARPGKIDLKEFAGDYQGLTVAGFGRYELRAGLKTGWLGRAEATLTIIDLQSHFRSSLALKLVPAGGAGRYATVLTDGALPGAELKGEATAGTPASAAPGAAAAAGERQMDIRFADGALYRVRFAPDGPSALNAQVWWAAPGTKAGTFAVKLTRLPPAKS
ncbi:MAG TPA: hypothetical protein VH309_09270, partial [Elusimicrobiota bacterium]|jgi:hypothetical protein|nr:hypothetical protein [Elusimicrobiota bacterium]